MKLRYLLVLGTLSLAVQSFAQGCESWNTAWFFESATPAEVRGCLEAGADVNEQSRLLTPLHYAAQFSDDPAIIRILVEAGAEVNAWGGHDLTPLRVAAMHSTNPAIIRALVAAGADWDEQGWTPLHDAARYNPHPAIITALVAAGLEVDARTGADVTPLHIAAARNTNPAVIEALLNAGADPAARDDEGKTPWDLAKDRTLADFKDADLLDRLVEPLATEECLGRDVWATAGAFFESATLERVVDCLATGVDVNARTETGGRPLPCWNYSIAPECGLTPLHYAVQFSDDPAIIAALVEAGAEVDAWTAERWTPLHFAAESSTPAIIELLLDAGATAAAHNKDFRTPWDYARDREELKGSDAYRRLELAVECLEWNTQEFFESASLAGVVACLTAGAEVKARSDTLSLTPLHYAAALNGSAAVIGALVAAGAEVDARDIYDHTPLHSAARYSGSPAVILALLDAGADTAARSGDGNTPWDYAKDNEVLRKTDAYWRLNEGRFE